MDPPIRTSERMESMSDHVENTTPDVDEFDQIPEEAFPAPVTDIEAEIADLSEGYRPDLAEVEVSTQEANPGSAVGRTAVQVGLPSFALLGLVIPEIVDATLERFGASMPEEIRGWLLAAAAVTTGVSAIVARVMAIPGVNDWLREHAPALAPENKTAA